MHTSLFLARPCRWLVLAGVLLACFAGLSLAQASQGQEPQDQESQDRASQGRDAADTQPQPTVTPADVDPTGGSATAMLATPPEELSLRIAVASVEELDAMATDAVGALRAVGGPLVEGVIATRRASAAGEAPDARALAEAGALTELRDGLASRSRTLLAALDSRGVDVAARRATVDAIAAIETPSPAPAQADQPERPADEAAAVASLIESVRADPPVHDRPEPWTVPLGELALELQPLRKEQVAERLESWLGILQREVRARIRMDIATSNRAETDAQKARLAELSGQQQRTIDAIVDRVALVAKTLEQRGGDASEARQYVADATGQKLNLFDPAVLARQVRAKVTNWLTSETGGIAFGLGVVSFVVTLLVFWVVARLASGAVAAALTRSKRSTRLLRDFLVVGTRRLILLIGIVVAASNAGVQTGPLLAAIGAAGLVIGLALQGTLSNFASGILILFFKPFDVGDVVNAGGVSGKIDKMSLFSTTISTFDNQAMYVPNNAIWNNVITNATGRPTRRVDLTFGIGYADDAARACEVLSGLVAAHPKILKDPAPTIRVNELADSSVNIVVRPWCRTADYWDVYWDLHEQVKRTFDAEGINIPFPQRDMHLPGPVEVVLRQPQPDA